MFFALLENARDCAEKIIRIYIGDSFTSHRRLIVLGGEVLADIPFHKQIAHSTRRTASGYASFFLLHERKCSRGSAPDRQSRCAFRSLLVPRFRFQFFPIRKRSKVPTRLLSSVRLFQHTLHRTLEPRDPVYDHSQVQGGLLVLSESVRESPRAPLPLAPVGLERRPTCPIENSVGVKRLAETSVEARTVESVLESHRTRARVF